MTETAPTSSVMCSISDEHEPHSLSVWYGKQKFGLACEGSNRQVREHDRHCYSQHPHYGSCDCGATSDKPVTGCAPCAENQHRDCNLITEQGSTCCCCCPCESGQGLAP